MAVGKRQRISNNEIKTVNCKAVKMLRAVCCGVGALTAGFITISAAMAGGPYDNWYFTAERIQAAYQYQENYGERINNPLRASGCFLGQKEFTAPYRGSELVVPCHFITEIIRHIKEMLEIGAAKYLFPLDANHAHFGIPLALWEGKYRHLPDQQVLNNLLRDPAVVALYHTAEHLELADPDGGEVNSQTKAWRDKRNVLGFFDGRPITILAPHPKGQGVGLPDEYWSYAGFNFLASPEGEIYLFTGNRSISFDVAFDTDVSEEARFSKQLVPGANKMIRTRLRNASANALLRKREAR